MLYELNHGVKIRKKGAAFEVFCQRKIEYIPTLNINKFTPREEIIPKIKILNIEYLNSCSNFELVFIAEVILHNAIVDIKGFDIKYFSLKNVVIESKIKNLLPKGREMVLEYNLLYDCLIISNENDDYLFRIRDRHYRSIKEIAEEIGCEVVSQSKGIKLRNEYKKKRKIKGLL